MVEDIAILLASLVVLGIAAHFLVQSSVKIARVFGLSEMLIGLTLVAWGTSAPEIAVSVNAALEGQGALSVANVIGSNIFNLGFILGLVAVVFPQKVHPKMVKRDGLVLLLSTFIVLGAVWDFKVTLVEGIILLTLLFSYGAYLWFKKDVEAVEIVHDIEEEKNGKFKNLLLFGISLFFLVKASDYTVEAASSIASSFGISEWAIGATIVAAGTSLPEVATSVVATFKRKFDISIGNVIGSDIFNALGIIGISAVVAPLHLEVGTMIAGFPDFIFSQGLLIFTLILILIFLRTGWKLSRTEGVILLAIATSRMAFEIYLGMGT